MGETFVVGRDCDAWCSKCKLDLAHTIVAMVGGRPKQVKCNTCGTWHAYHPPKDPALRPRSLGTARSSSSREPRERAPRAPRVPAPPRSAVRAEARWQEALAGATAEPRPYDVRASFAPGDVVDHPKFGRGVVTRIEPPKKAHVVFRDDERTLLMGHGAAPAGATQA